MKNWEFNKSLQSRGLNHTRLAALIGTSREQVCQTLNNRRGGRTRPKLFPFLTVEEIALLGWTDEFEQLRPHVPRGTK